MKLDFRTSNFFRILAICQKCCGSSPSALGIKTWGRHHRSLRRKSWGYEQRMLHLDLIWSLEIWLQNVRALMREDGLISEMCPGQERFAGGRDKTTTKNYKTNMTCLATRHDKQRKRNNTNSANATEQTKRNKPNSESAQKQTMKRDKTNKA